MQTAAYEKTPAGEVPVFFCGIRRVTEKREREKNVTRESFLGIYISGGIERGGKQIPQLMVLL